MATRYIPSPLPTIPGGERQYLSRELDKIATALNNSNESVSYVVYEPQATAPALPKAGMTYFDAASAKLKTWDGTVWRDHW